jgi:fatty acid-binding protein DegV
MEISEQICQKLRDYGFKEVYDVDAGSTISSHCGPGTLGILFINKE